MYAPPFFHIMLDEATLISQCSWLNGGTPHTSLAFIHAIDQITLRTRLLFNIAGLTAFISCSSITKQTSKHKRKKILIATYYHIIFFCDHRHVNLVVSIHLSCLLFY
jgi:hypothetical protein